MKFAYGGPAIPDVVANPLKARPTTRWEHRYLGQEQFPETLSAVEIEHFFTLDEVELVSVRERRGPLNRLALALQIGFLKLTGRTLNSVELIPPQILDHLGRQVDCAAPRIASIRAFYRRRHRTLFKHHASALRLLRRSELTPHAERGLVAYLRREAAAVFDDAELMARARSWLVEHDYLLLRERHIRRLAIAARRHQQQALFKLIAAAMPAERDLWVPRLLAPVEEGGISRREWLDAVPSSRSAQSLAEQMEKVSFLKELGADRLAMPELPLAGLEYFARRMMSRKPAALTRIKDPHRTIEVACFLRLTLLRLTDASLTLLDHQVSALWHGARERVQETQAARLRRLLGDLAGLADDETLDAAELRSRLKSLITPFEPERQGTQVASIRQELGRKSQDLARLLKLAREAPLAVPTDHKLAAAFATLDALSGSPNALPDNAAQPFGPSWQALTDQPDRAAALGCYRAATLMGLKRALRNRSVSVDHSLSYRAPEKKLIPEKLWQRDRGRFIRDLNLPASSEKYLQRLEAGLSAGLAALAEAVEAGAVAIEGGEVRLPRRKPAPKDPRLEPARQALAHALGDVQFPEVLIEIDGLTRFSWTLLGRPARSEQELVTLYAALMGLGSDLSVAELVRMVPALAADSLGQMMLKIEAEKRLRSANDAVLRFMRAHSVAALWGRGLFASADMMSLEATRYLWSARLDPRRRTYAVGTYAHVLDQWGILYDQPIVLNRRQAGAAIEGALRQRQVARIERVAVDTHGFTHFAMALAKAVGFDLCPHLAKLKKRKLYLPKGLEIPQVLRPIVAETVSRRAIARGWEGFLRLGASVKHGWDSATLALDRFGSAAAGDPVYNAGDGLGRLLRTLYLCDYLSNPPFRLEVLDLLNQGEAVHSLQRAIHNRMITAKHGRTMEQLGTISGALTLLANIVMAWNTHRIQAMIDASLGDHPDEVMRRLAPIGHKHINLRGILTFDLGRHRSSLLRQASSTALERVPG
ncbi:MAG TPA: Tn3 family transposase [Stellaceae bacterium]|nr:Tn3 family transposase [Stellaceae bacterium]HTW54820.1 Tn3 family transposase [Stellaceae bacterium]HUC12474.1 Tn3 family transposase [Stellaceae bacterium]